MKLLFKPLSMAASVLGGLLAGAVFKQVWKALSGEDEAPEATSPEYTARKVILAAVMQGAIVGGVKAAVDRASAKGIDALATSKPQHKPHRRTTHQARHKLQPKRELAGRRLSARSLRRAVHK